MKWLGTEKYRQKQLVELLDEHQPIASNLLHGKISQMSLEKLLAYADRLGLKLDIYRARSRRRSPGVPRTESPHDRIEQSCRGQSRGQNRGQTGLNRPKQTGMDDSQVVEMTVASNKSFGS